MRIVQRLTTRNRLPRVSALVGLVLLGISGTASAQYACGRNVSGLQACAQQYTNYHEYGAFCWNRTSTTKFMLCSIDVLGGGSKRIATDVAPYSYLYVATWGAPGLRACSALYYPASAWFPISQACVN